MCEGTLGEQGQVTLQDSAARRLTNQRCITNINRSITTGGHEGTRKWVHANHITLNS